MRRYFLVPMILLLLGCIERNSEYPWVNKSFVGALELAGDRLVMIDFFTDG